MYGPEELLVTPRTIACWTGVIFRALLLRIMNTPISSPTKGGESTNIQKSRKTLSSVIKISDESNQNVVWKIRFAEAARSLLEDKADVTGENGRRYTVAALKLFGGKHAVSDRAAEHWVLTELKHKNIVAYQGSVADLGVPHIMLEYIPHPLEYAIVIFKENRRAAAIHVLRQLLAVVDHLHRHNVLHMDIKPDNVRMQTDGTVILFDFGNSVLPRDVFDPVETKLTTMWYRAPERFRYNAHFCTAMDVWAIGCVVYEILKGRIAFEPDPSLFDVVQAIARSDSRFRDLGAAEQHLVICEACTLCEIMQSTGTLSAQGVPQTLVADIAGEFAATSSARRSPLMGGPGKDDEHSIEHLVARMLEPNPTLRISIADARAHPCFATETLPPSCIATRGGAE